MFPPSAEQPQQSDEQVVPQPTLSPSVSDGFSNAVNRTFMNKHRPRYHVGRDEHMRFLEPLRAHVSTQELTFTSLRSTDGRDHNKHLMCRTTLAQYTPCWATTVQLCTGQTKLTQFTLCRPKQHTRGLGWEEV